MRFKFRLIARRLPLRVIRGVYSRQQVEYIFSLMVFPAIYQWIRIDEQVALPRMLNEPDKRPKIQ